MIGEADLDAIVAAVERAPPSDAPSDALIGALRREWPSYHFTYCQDDDVAAAARPIRERARFNLYLVAGRGGCISFTRDPDSATGLVIAERDDDDI
jgi:hypothetical protein